MSDTPKSGVAPAARSLALAPPPPQPARPAQPLAPKRACWCVRPEQVELWSVLLDGEDRALRRVAAHRHGDAWHAADPAAHPSVEHPSARLAVAAFAVRHGLPLVEVCDPQRAAQIARSAGGPEPAAEVVVRLDRDEARQWADHLAWLRAAPSTLATAPWVAAVEGAVERALEPGAR